VILSSGIAFLSGGPSWLDDRIRKKVTSRRKPDRVLVAVVGAAVMGDAEIETRIAEYEGLLTRGQIPPPSLLSVAHSVELIYEVRLRLAVLSVGFRVVLAVPCVGGYPFFCDAGRQVRD